jgi:4-amino-4-deoxy-L-arabinose transferase-like glycosyltransferase
MSRPLKNSFPWREILAAFFLLGGVLWLRWPSLGFGLWNVDEAIHAAVARTLLDGGVLYRDAVDLRAPLSYYAEAAVFALAGENNLWAMRFLIALLIAGTAWSLFVAGRHLRGFAAGAGAGLIFAILTSCLFYPVDAYASNTEWFLAFFTAAAAAMFLGGKGSLPSPRRLFGTGLLLGGAFLSKQPALLELAAPATALLWLAWRRQLTAREFWSAGLALAAGWLLPVLLTVLYFAARGALGDLVFYSWTYNLAYYGPEITTADRAAALLISFRLLLAGAQGLLLALWVTGGGVLLYRLAQRQPTPEEKAAHPASAYLLVWSLVALAGAASSGREFEHYVIQFLPAFALGAGLASAGAGQIARSAAHRWFVRVGAALAVAGAAWLLFAIIPGKRHRTIPADPSQRVAAYIREHSAATDRIFVWGFHPDIYLEANRRAASRFVICTFVTGLIPWTNVAPERDTAYAAVPGSLDTLLRDLAASRPVFIVDCSVGANRHWQKYPPEKYPALHDFIRRNYRQVESHVFVPQGFRLYQLRSPTEPAVDVTESPLLDPGLAAALKLDLLASSLRPIQASARHGASHSIVDGRSELFAHAPSSIVYRIPAGVAALRGGYGLRTGAYASTNRDSTDGAEFIVRWRPAGGGEQVLLQRVLRPREEPADQGVQPFRVTFPPHAGGELELVTGPGPSGLATSDWSFWADLILENYP